MRAGWSGRVSAIALFLAILATPVLAEETPVDVVRRLYAEPRAGASDLQTTRLRGLFAAAAARPPSGGALTFDYRVNHEPVARDVTADLSFVETRSGPTRADVDVSLVDDRPQRLVYTVVREDGAWRIDDVRSLGEPSWLLSALLKGDTH
jgi:hypothetical protein